MQLPSALRNLDERVLGRRGRARDAHRADDTADTADSTAAGTSAGTADHSPAPEPAHADHHHVRPGSGREERVHRPPRQVGREVLGRVWRVSRLVFLALALVVLLGIVLTFAPTNDDNVLVRWVLSWAETAAGPFRDVFTADEPRRALLYNYALATGVWLLAAALVTKLPGGRSTR